MWTLASLASSSSSWMALDASLALLALMRERGVRACEAGMWARARPVGMREWRVAACVRVRALMRVWALREWRMRGGA